MPFTPSPLSAADQCTRCVLRPLLFYASPTPEEGPGPERLRQGTRILPAKTTICRAGEITSVYYTLLEGWAFRYKLLPDGRRQILSFLLPGDTISFQLMRSERLHFSVQALTDVSLCVFDREELSRYVAERPALVARLDELTARETAASDDRLTDLGRRAAHERVARLLVQLSLRLRRRNLEKDGSFVFPLRQHHIADALGLTTVHVSRVLKQLKKDGLVSIDDQRLTIRDAHMLRKVSGYSDGDGDPEERL